MPYSTQVLRTMVVACFVLTPVAALAQWDKKPYTNWSLKETQKILDDSPWGQTQVFTDTSTMLSTGPGAQPSSKQVRLDTSPDYLSFRIRLLSAKPIRQAMTRLLEIGQKGELSGQDAEKLRSFVTSDFTNRIVVSVAAEASDTRGQLQKATAVLNSATSAQLKNKTYLQAKGGERVFLEEYIAPGKDGRGAQFIFPRILNGQPFIRPEHGEVQFYSELSPDFILNMRYKLKEMTFEGKLEY